MVSHCTLQIHRQGQWHDAATVALWGSVEEGWRCKTYAGYETDWSIRHFGRNDAHALTCRWPVGLEALESPHWPVFLIDMLPQGFGRAELLRRLGLQVSSEQPADWPLLLAGAGNPIGHLRVKEAAVALVDAAQGAASGPSGFSDEEVSDRVEAFSEYLAAHGLFVAGSSGVQGEWPKLLLTRGHDGLLYLDHTLPDEQAQRITSSSSAGAATSSWRRSCGTSRSTWIWRAIWACRSSRRSRSPGEVADGCCSSRVSTGG